MGIAAQGDSTEEEQTSNVPNSSCAVSFESLLAYGRQHLPNGSCNGEKQKRKVKAVELVD